MGMTDRASVRERLIDLGRGANYALVTTCTFPCPLHANFLPFQCEERMDEQKRIRRKEQDGKGEVKERGRK